METKRKVVKYQPIRKHEMVEKGEAIYARIKDKLEKEHKKGEIVVIDVDSGDYFFGKNIIAATEKGWEKYPEKVFYAVRIGYRAVYRFSGYVPLGGGL